MNALPGPVSQRAPVPDTCLQPPPGSGWSRHEAALAAVEAQLARRAGTPALLFERAALLDRLGRTEDARQAYLDLIVQAPDHEAGLNNLGALLWRTGYRSAARTAFAQAAACWPDRPAGHVNLANLLREDADAAAALPHYRAALAAAPDLAEAHRGLGSALAELGDGEGAAHHLGLGYRAAPFTAWTYRGRSDPVRVLLLVSVVAGNLPARALLDETRFAVTAVAMEFWTPLMALPPHDRIVNAIGDADLCREALRAAARLVRHSAAPVINPPGAVLRTGRQQNARQLAGIAGVRTPRIASLPRARLIAPDAARTLAREGFGFPLLLRAPGFHTGQHFLRVAEPDSLVAAVAALPGERLLVIEQLDARGPDGLARKYRVMLLGGRILPLHLAISPDWKVHYFTAAMADQPAHRAEEAAFLADMATVLGPRAMAGLAAIAARLGLDYAGIDFGIGADGSLLLFEANATMVMLPPPEGAIWAYRRPAFARAMAAAREMLGGR